MKFLVPYTYNRTIYQDYSLELNEILIIIVWLKNLIIILKSSLKNTIYASSRAKRINRLFQTSTSNDLNAFKSYFKTNSFSLLAKVFVIGIFFFAISIRLIER